MWACPEDPDGDGAEAGSGLLAVGPGQPAEEVVETVSTVQMKIVTLDVAHPVSDEGAGRAMRAPLLPSNRGALSG